MRPLAEYQRKRNFRVTPEPGAKRGSRKKAKLIFVVQEHHASHLHYDFRLEWDGVLKSWAVPKGPSLDPSQKRLAVQTEDHPMEYAKFTGTIPAGEYGAGDVYRWDYGTWEPVTDPDEGFRKGHLEFRLKGKKLNGGFRLVRTRGGEGRQMQWLLMKRHDEFAREGAEAKADAGPRSTPKKKSPKRKAKAKEEEHGDFEMPQFISPQLAQLVSDPPTGEDWIHEIKFDGYRIQAHIENGKVKLYTRRGLDWTHKYESLARALKKLNVENAIIDGEVVWQDQQGRFNFQKLQNAMKLERTDALVYWVFDLLFLNGKDLTSLPLMARKDRLEKLVAQLKNPNIRFSEHFRESGQRLFKATCDMQLEGIISKRVDRPYSPGRREDWAKTKCQQRQEFVVGGFSDPDGSRIGFGSLLLGVYEGKDLRYVGRVGTGFDQRTLEDINKRLRKIEVSKPPFSKSAPRGARYHWVKPTLVAEVSFNEWTADKHLRAPVFHGLRSDKEPSQIGIERPRTVITDERAPKGRTAAAALSSEPKRRKAATSKKTPIEKPKVTHPDRVIYKKEKLTKQDVADYYQAVTEWMLPHLENRPLSMVRCTQNSETGCFFSKHFSERLPEHFIRVPDKGHQDFITIDSPEGLAQLIQYGSLEIHPWNCHAKDIEAPDQIVMDFDPDETVDFETVKEGAFELRDLLKQLGLKSFVKVTGGKGLHVQFPFEPLYDWDTVKNFAKTLSLEMVSRHPDLYTANIVKKARKNKIFLDYLRNGRGATAVAPYSLRARPASAVAMPISWDELKTLDSASVFTMPRALQYLKKRKRDPWRDYFSTRQKIALLS